MHFQPDSSNPPGVGLRAPAPETVALNSRLHAQQPWPDDLLEAFCLRMASQGMCVSRALMQHDRHYGLEQLTHAHNMADDRLREMAVQLFQCFLARPSGISNPH